MSATLGDLSILFNAFGAGIGFFWSYLLLKQGKSERKFVLLSALLGVFSLLMINTIVQLSGYGEKIPAYQDIANAITYLIGPLIYGYTLAHTRTSPSYLKRFWVHLLPCWFLLPFLLWTGNSGSWHQVHQSLIYAWNAQMLLYLAWGYRELKQKEQAQALPAKLIQYLFPIWLINFVLFLLKTHLFPVPDIVFLNVTLLLSYLILIVAFRSLKQEQKQEKSGQGFTLSHQHYQQYAFRLQRVMEQAHLYRNPDLSIQELATFVDISPRYVSATLNHQLQQSFYEFVNGYRIKEVVEKLQAPESETFTLNGIAGLAGFKSPSAFYKAFRKHTGMTPGAFRKQLSHSDRNMK